MVNLLPYSNINKLNIDVVPEISTALGRVHGGPISVEVVL